MTSWYKSDSDSDSILSSSGSAMLSKESARAQGQPTPAVRHWQDSFVKQLLQQEKFPNLDIEQFPSVKDIEPSPLTKDIFREHFFSQHTVHRGLDRCPPVDYMGLEKVSVRGLTTQAGHISGVIAGIRSLQWRELLGRSISGILSPTPCDYQIVQLPCNDETFAWLWSIMIRGESTSLTPRVIAVPVTYGIIEVIVAKNEGLPESHYKPQSMAPGIMGRQAAFHPQVRKLYGKIISAMTANVNHIMKDIVESLTLVPCRWSVVDNSIAYRGF
ncbi:MAG: hypothetical protein Q9210_000590 [Variospora velana]